MEIGTVNVGVVGAGNILCDRHGPAFKAIGGVRLISVANRSRESSERAASELGFARVHSCWPGVVQEFPYEPVFPAEHVDFCAPLLRGIEHEAEQVGADLLIFTSGPVREGVRDPVHGQEPCAPVRWRPPAGAFHA